MDPFSTLGLSARFDLDAKEIESRYRDLHRALHPDRFTQAPANERRASLNRAVQVNEAYRALRDDIARAKALLAFHGQAVTDTQPADPELLMEMMERRESLAEARSDLTRVRRLAEEIRAAYAASKNRLGRAFASIESADDIERAPIWSAAREELTKLRYYRRFLDEVEAIEDEAL